MFLPLTSSSRLRVLGPLFLCALLLALGYRIRSTCLRTSRLRLVKVLVTYHSLSGNTERMAEAVVEGVKSVSGAERRVETSRQGDGGRFALLPMRLWLAHRSIGRTCRAR